MRFMTWSNLWRLIVFIPMAAVFSRIDFITPFVKGQVVRGIVLAFLAMFLWVVMVAYISWIRNDAVKKAIEEEEN